MKCLFFSALALFFFWGIFHVGFTLGVFIPIAFTGLSVKWACQASQDARGHAGGIVPFDDLPR